MMPQTVGILIPQSSPLIRHKQAAVADPNQAVAPTPAQEGCTASSENPDEMWTKISYQLLGPTTAMG